MGVFEMDNIVFEKITSGILSSNELGIEKWIVIIFVSLLPVLINILYKSVNSKYYNINERYFNFLSLKKLIVYVCVFIFVILSFSYLFYAFIINFSMGKNILFLLPLTLLAVSFSELAYGLKINLNRFKDLKIDSRFFRYIFYIFVIISIIFCMNDICSLVTHLHIYAEDLKTKLKFARFIRMLLEISFKRFVIFYLIIATFITIFLLFKKSKKVKKSKSKKTCNICKVLKKCIVVVHNSLFIITNYFICIALLSCLIFSNRINENLNNSFEKNSKINQNQHQDISDENNKNDNMTKDYLNYVLKNSGDLKFNEFVTLFKNPEDLIRLNIDNESGVNKSILKLYLVRFFYNVEKTNIEKELFASMRLLIILNLLLDPIIFIFAMASIFILTGALLLLLRDRFFNPNKIKTYEYIDKPGLMKEVVITEYKDKLLIINGFIYKNNLYLDRTNYRIIDLSDELKLAQEKFDSVIFDMLDFFIPVIIIDYCGKESKHNVDISFNTMKKTLRLKIYDNNFNLNEIEISCDVSFKNNCMIIKSEIKHILETIYGINNFKFKLDESAEKNFSIDENTGEITINLDLE